ncbi:MAG: hypothetical protein AAF591_06260, partial [Verrucomicrobiota bacterium]
LLGAGSVGVTLGWSGRGDLGGWAPWAWARYRLRNVRGRLFEDVGLGIVMVDWILDSAGMKALLIIVTVLSLGFVGSGWAGDQVAVTALPAPVLQSIQAYFPGSTPISAEVEEDDGAITYEVKIQYKDLAFEVELTPQGRVVDLDM